MGASISFNWIGATIEAYVKRATLTSTNGDILLSAYQAGEIVALAVGGQGAGNVAVGGSVVIGVVQNTVKAYLENDTWFN